MKRNTENKAIDQSQEVIESLAKAAGEIRKAVRPMGGYIGGDMKMSAGRWGATIEITIGFQADVLKQYIAQSSRPSKGTARK